MKRLVYAVLAFGALAVPVYANTSISASSITDAFGNPLSTARLCFMPVDVTETPVGFRNGTTQVIPIERCGTVTSGVLAGGLSLVPNIAGTYYHVYLRPPAAVAILRDYGMTPITGTSWTLDSYDPSMATIPVSAISIGNVTALSPGATPTVTLRGSSPYYLDFGVPVGASGTNCASGGSPSTCNFNGTLNPTIIQASETNLGTVTDARFFGVSPANTAAQNQTAFAALAAAVNAGTTSSHIFLPDGTYNVLSTGGTALGTYNVAIDFECASWNTIINHTGTGYLIQMGPSGYVEFSSVNFWSPQHFQKCQLTGGSSGAGGIYYPAGADGLVIDFNYFYNYGSASNWAVLTTGSNELEMAYNSYMRTDGVLGQFVRQPFQYYNYLSFHDNRMVCTTSPTNGASIPCGTGVWASGDLEASRNLVSGPAPAFVCDGAQGTGATCAVENNLLEWTAAYLVEFGLPGGSGPTTYNMTVRNNRVEEYGSASSGFVGPANSTAGLNTSDISGNTLRLDAQTTLPAIVLNNVGTQGHNQAMNNIGWDGGGRGINSVPSVHSLGQNISPFVNGGLFHDQSIVEMDSGSGLILASALGLATDSFPGSTLSPAWTVLEGSFAVGSNSERGNSAGNSVAYYNAGTFPADQFSEITVGGSLASGELGVGVRLQSGAASGYVLDCVPTSCGIYKVTAGSSTALATSSVTLASGGDLRLSAVGSVLTAYFGGVAFLTVSDSTYTSGQPGIEANGSATGMIATVWDAPGPLYKNPAQGYYAGLGSASFASSSAAGSGGSLSTPSCYTACTSTSGVVSMTTGNSPGTSGTILTITLAGQTRPNAATCHVTASNTSTGAVTELYTANSTTTACLAQAPGTALTANQAYFFTYHAD